MFNTYHATGMVPDCVVQFMPLKDCRKEMTKAVSDMDKFMCFSSPLFMATKLNAVKISTSEMYKDIEYFADNQKFLYSDIEDFS